MATTIPAAPEWKLSVRIAAILARLPARRDNRGAPDRSHEDVQARRDVIHEVRTRSPNAFSGEIDVQSMMFMYPGRF